MAKWCWGVVWYYTYTLGCDGRGNLACENRNSLLMRRMGKAVPKEPFLGVHVIYIRSFAQEQATFTRA